MKTSVRIGAFEIDDGELHGELMRRAINALYLVR